MAYQKILYVFLLLTIYLLMMHVYEDCMPLNTELGIIFPIDSVCKHMYVPFLL